jgi:hypothetical protein
VEEEGGVMQITIIQLTSSSDDVNDTNVWQRLDLSMSDSRRVGDP